jgi:hypothetical protein
MVRRASGATPPAAAAAPEALRTGFSSDVAGFLPDVESRLPPASPELVHEIAIAPASSAPITL